MNHPSIKYFLINSSCLWSTEPWYADIVNYLAIGEVLSHWTTQDRHNFFAQVKYFILSSVLIKSLEGVSRTMRLEAFYLSVMTKHVVVTLHPRKQLPKSFNMNFIGLIYLRMHTSTVEVVLDANKWSESSREIWCLSIQL